MAVTRRTLWLLRALRVEVGDHTDEAVRALTAAWVQAWDLLDAEWHAAMADVVALYAATDRWPAPWQLARIDRLAAAQQQTATALAALAATTNTTVGAGAVEVIAATAAAEPAIMASQLPARLAAAALDTYTARITPTVLETIASRARAQIHADTWPLTDDAVQAMRRALVAGVATGAHPTEAARSMVRQVEGAFNGGLGRALNIARTEMLDAYRDTSAAVHAANADVLDGWTWVATLDRRTCPSCWGMHGTHHPLTQPGPWDHHQGRCARMPKVKSWVELGIPDVEGEDLTPDAEKVFAALPRDEQLAVMGPGRLALLTAGRINFSDLAARRDSLAWRPSYVPRPVRDLEALAARRTVA
ncbi:phage minor head protein [Micromonospora sp. NPDC049366]|uniref:phage minor head protein n=1 Tax=Micromonospora sp. NPDC049366 TaxID=3364271 RepID=UPI0037B04382